MNEFIEFPKIPRYSRDCVITEKIDGTNGQILITPDGELLVGSRSRWLGPTPQNDNHSFFSWATEHTDELKQLGPGRHFGEWWGQGINRGYGLKEKRFSLFNVTRWDENVFNHFKVKVWEGNPDKNKGPKPEFKAPPACCGVIPIVGFGEFTTYLVENCLRLLEIFGSYAVYGYMNPEGIVIYHTAGNCLFKKTLRKDEERKTKMKELR